MSNSLGGLDHTTFASRHAAREGGSSVVPLENLEMFERMGVSFSYIILADAHFSHDTPRNSVLDLPVACFPRAREPGSTPSIRRAPQVCRKASKIDRGRPPPLDLSVALLARLALGVGHRQARNGRSLASCRLSFVLDLQGALRKTRTTRHFKRTPRSDSQDVPGESRWGCTTDPRRTSQTRHRHRREQCQQIYGALPQTAVSDLARLPGEPCPAAGFDRLLHRAHHPVPGPFRISGVGP